MSDEKEERTKPSTRVLKKIDRSKTDTYLSGFRVGLVDGLNDVAFGQNPFIGTNPVLAGCWVSGWTAASKLELWCKAKK